MAAPRFGPVRALLEKAGEMLSLQEASALSFLQAERGRGTGHSRAGVVLYTRGEAAV